jgi:tRNA dimethylallyltransferase
MLKTMKYQIITYGCQMNKSDSERIAGYLEKIGLKPSMSEKETDLIVFNLCSIRQSAIDRATAKIKQKRDTIKANILLTGCILDKDKKKLEKISSLIFNINELSNLGEILNKFGFKTKKIKKLNNYFKIEPKYSSNITANVPIMTGCNNFCSFCVVPHTRGREVSRPAEEILCEVKNLVKGGIKEIWLLGQNVNSYRDGRGKTRKNSEINFAKLLQMVNDIPGDFWIRFTSSHPKDLTKGLIETIARSKKITPYFNLPIQSGDDKILKAMNRPYTVKDYKNLVKKIKRAFKKYRKGRESELALSTDLIVGCPKEGKKEFKNTKKIIKEIGFAFGYISRYSPRPNTIAGKLKDSVTSQEKKEREKELVKIVEASSLNFNKKFLNKIVDVLVLYKKKGFYFGKTRHYQTIKIKSKKNILGKFVQAKVVNATPYGLEGGGIKGGGSFCGGRASAKLVVVLGPTSSGKSDLAVEIAKKFNGEIISADSRQVYKGMDIGTGKITKKEMQGIPHHLLDVASPKRIFSVSKYKKLANNAIKEIIEKGKLPIFCGGTGFYIQAVVDDITIPKVKPDWPLRRKLEKKTGKQLFFQLKKLDPNRAKTIDKNNKRRLIRAIEIITKTKKPIPQLKKKQKFNPLFIGIKTEPEELKKRIERRLKQRFKKGMIKEVKKLYASGVSYKRMQDLGLEYRYIAYYLQNKITLQQTKEMLQKEIKKYSKRQMTWFKRDKRIIWIINKKQAFEKIKKWGPKSPR